MEQRLMEMQDAMIRKFGFEDKRVISFCRKCADEECSMGALETLFACWMSI